MTKFALKPLSWVHLAGALVASVVSSLSWGQTAKPCSPTHHCLQQGGLSVEIETEVDRLTGQFGPRFDRTAMISQIRVDDQSLVGPWGLADEFGLQGVGVLGFEQADLGEVFVKIGVGTLIKDMDAPYAFSHPYPIDTLFPVEVQAEPDQLKVIQRTPSQSPWPYRYEKTYRLISDRELQILYELTNLSDQVILIEHYNHHWFRLEDLPIGPSYQVNTGFDLPNQETGLLQESRSLALPELIDRGEAQYYASDFEGLSAAASHFEWQVASRARVKYESSDPISRFALYADPDGFCPEMFTQHRIEPEQTVRWSSTYHFPSPHSN